MDVLQPQDAIVSLCQELVACVTKILDPLSAQADRATSNQVARTVPINEHAKHTEVFDPTVEMSYTESHKSSSETRLCVPVYVYAYVPVFFFPSVDHVS